MRLKDYYYELDAPGRSRYARMAGTSTEYLRIHLIPPSGDPDRIPRPDLMRSLALASDGAVSQQEVIEHFYLESTALRTPPPRKGVAL